MFCLIRLFERPRRYDLRMPGLEAEELVHVAIFARTSNKDTYISAVVLGGRGGVVGRGGVMSFSGG